MTQNSPLTENLSQVLRNLPGVFYKCNLGNECQLIEISGEVEILTGFSKDDLVNNTPISFVHPDDQNWVLEERKKLAEQRTNGIFEYRVITRNREIRWIRDITYSYPNPVNQSEYVSLGLMHDITDLKSRISGDHAFLAYQRAINSGSIVSVTDRHGVIIFVNDLFCEVSKYAKEELIGKNHRIINSGLHDSQFFKTLWESIRSGKTWRGEIRNKAKDGTYYWVDTVITPVMNDKGEIHQFLSIRNLITDKKNLEEKLKQSGDFLKNILNSLPALVAVISSTGLIIEINKAWENYYSKQNDPGLTGKGIGDNLFEAFEKSSENGLATASLLLKGLNDLKENRKDSFNLEYPCFSDTRKRWFLLTATRIPDQDFIVINQVDITDSKLTEIQLRESKKRLRTIIDSEPECVKVLNNNLVLLEINKAGLRMIDADSADQVIGKNLIEMVDEGYKERFKKLIENALAGIPGNLVFEVTTLKGAKRIFDTHAVPFYNEGSDPQTLSITRDITGKRKVENELNELYEKYKSVVENINDALLIDDIDGRVVFANKQFEHLFDLQPGDLDNLTFKDFVSNEQQDYVNERHKKRVSGFLGVEDSFEFLGVTKKGNKIWLEAKVSPLTKNRKIIGTISVIRNIHQRKMDELELERNNSELTRINEELDKFVYSTSHDLRAPLLSVLSLVNICQEDFYPNDQEFQEITNKMKEGLNRTDQIIRRILEYSRNKRFEVRFEPLKLYDVVDEVIRGCRFMADMDEVFIEMNIPEDMVVVTDKTRISLILENLITNAIKYQRKNEKHKFVLLKASVDRDGTTIEIEDNGEGIPEENQFRIFDMFYRGSINSSGSGLGLYIVKQTLESVNGTISLHSKPNEGSRFSVFLPGKTNNHE